MAYNTTPFSGKLARSEKNDVLIDFTEGWTLAIAYDNEEKSRQGQDAKEIILNQYGWSGTISAQAVFGNTEHKALFDAFLAGTLLGDMKFLLDGSTNGFVGDLYIVNYSIDTSNSAKVLHKFDFTGSGTIAITDAA